MAVKIIDKTQLNSSSLQKVGLLLSFSLSVSLSHAHTHTHTHTHAHTFPTASCPFFLKVAFEFFPHFPFL